MECRMRKQRSWDAGHLLRWPWRRTYCVGVPRPQRRAHLYGEAVQNAKRMRAVSLIYITEDGATSFARQAAAKELHADERLRWEVRDALVQASDVLLGPVAWQAADVKRPRIRLAGWLRSGGRALHSPNGHRHA